jgi:hypothetical protein
VTPLAVGHSGTTGDSDAALPTTAPAANTVTATEHASQTRPSGRPRGQPIAAPAALAPTDRGRRRMRSRAPRTPCRNARLRQWSIAHDGRRRPAASQYWKPSLLGGGPDEPGVCRPGLRERHYLGWEAFATHLRLHGSSNPTESVALAMLLGALAHAATQSTTMPIMGTTIVPRRPGVSLD